MGQFEITLVGASTVEETIDLQNWIESGRIAGLHVTRKDKETDAGSLGSLETAIVIACVAKPIVTQLLKIIETWVRERKPRLSIKLEDMDSGKTISIDAENIGNLDKQLNKLLDTVG